MLDHGRRDALAEHAGRLVQEGTDHARGKEAARVVHHDRNFADLLDIIIRAGQRFRAGALALDNLDQLHFVDRREEVQADEAFGPRRRARQPADRQRRGVRGEDAVFGQQRLGLARDLVLELGVLEHRLDNQVAAGQVACVGGWVNAVEQFLSPGRAQLPALDAPDGDPGTVGLTLFGLLDRYIFQHGRDAARRVRVGNAAAHHARAEYADFGCLPARYVFWARGAAFDLVQLEKERADHIFSNLPGHELDEVATFDPRSYVERHLRALDRRAQNGLGGRVHAVGFLHQHCRRDGEHLGHVRAAGGPA